eukprot:352949-Chlamydomonas_euryale.AAC.5
MRDQRPRCKPQATLRQPAEGQRKRSVHACVKGTTGRGGRGGGVKQRRVSACQPLRNEHRLQSTAITDSWPCVVVAPRWEV